MTEIKPKLEYQLNMPCGDALPVIIVAAGNSCRMGQNKQLMEIGGIPVIVRTLCRFENSGKISKIILVTRTEDIFVMQSLCNKYCISKVSDIVSGGDSRQESVLKGFQRLGKKETAVLIHDGARPFTEERIIADVVNGLKEHTAVTCAVKVKDTIKLVDKNGKVINTPERKSLVAVQTPQGVGVAEYLAAVEKAGDVSVFTDDMSVMESAGYEVYTVEGDYKNIKITTPEDILIANTFFKEEEE